MAQDDDQTAPDLGMIEPAEVYPPDPEAIPRFDIVLRGYDRRQVDEHILGLHQMLAELETRLAEAEAQLEWGEYPERKAPDHETRADSRLPAAAPRPVPHPRSSPDPILVLGERLENILRTAEQETQAMRVEAAESVRAEQAEARRQLEELCARRDAVFNQLMQVRVALDDLVAASPTGGPAPAAGPNGQPQPNRA